MKVLPVFATDTLPLITCIPTCTPETSQISFQNYDCTDKGQTLHCAAKSQLTYPTATKSALVELNLEIAVGSSVGLVGSTGAGKTTLVDVILGLLRPTEGAITVDGVPITDVQLRAWQQSLGYVPQEIFSQTPRWQKHRAGYPIGAD